MAPRSSLVALAGVLLALAGCGSSSTTGTTGTTAATSAGTATAPTSAGEHVSLEANGEGQLKYNKTSLTAKAGAVSIDFTNMASLAHNVTVESSSGATLGATPTFQGGTKALTLDLKPGVYKFFCSVPGHRTAGMEGTLTVK
jgi:plastocyanin